MIKTQLSFATLREANARRNAIWDTTAEGLSLAFRGNELAGEVGEACNVIKKLERERLGIRGSRDTVEHLTEELADVIICVELIAMAMNIDLAHAVSAKFNETSHKQKLPIFIGAGDVVVEDHSPDLKALP